MASVNSPADLVNLALVRIGRKDYVANLWEGTDTSDAALNIYGQTRDAVLCEQDWDFAERNVALAVLKTAPAAGYFPPNVWNPATNPPVPWQFEYTYPDDCLKIRAIKSSPLMMPNFDPKPVLFSEENDTAFVPPRKVILCNVQAALMVYTGRVTDPLTWKPLFVEALVAALARRLAGVFGGGQMVQLEAQDEGSALAIASPERG